MEGKITVSVRSVLGKIALLLLFAFAIVILLATSLQESGKVPPQKPNILFIMLDDLDRYVYNRAMPRTRALLADRGVTFENATYSVPICCPSRASILRGQYPHNTGVYHNAPPNGGWPAFKVLGRQDSTYATWLNREGYATGYFGKYMNLYGVSDGGGVDPTVPPGWDRWFGTVNTTANTFFDGRGRVVDADERYGEASIHDTVVADRAADFVRDQARAGRPFLAAVNFYAPHQPAAAPPSYDAQFAENEVPRPPSYDEADISDKPTHIREQPRHTAEEQEVQRDYYSKRLSSANYADAQIARLIQALVNTGQLGNTYVFFYSDNGYHMGLHRLDRELGSKGTPYREDINFPIIVRGPGIAPGTTNDALVSNIDLAPTFARIAGATAPSFVDGRSFLRLARGHDQQWRKYAYAEALTPPNGSIPQWRAVYTKTTAYHDWFGVTEEELYHKATDPYQLENALHGEITPEEAAGRDRFRAVVAGMKDCRAAECRQIENGEVP